MSTTLRRLALDAFAFAFIVISQHGESLIYLKYTPIVLPSVVSLRHSLCLKARFNCKIGRAGGAFGKFDWMLMSGVRLQAPRAVRERSTPAVAHGI